MRDFSYKDNKIDAQKQTILSLQKNLNERKDEISSLQKNLQAVKEEMKSLREMLHLVTGMAAVGFKLTTLGFRGMRSTERRSKSGGMAKPRRRKTGQEHFE